MGFPMANRLVGAGYELVVWNRTASKAIPLVEKGASQAATPRLVAEISDVVITMLATPEALKEVAEGTDGIVAGLSTGLSTSASAWIEMSTVGPDVIHEMSRLLPREVSMVDAPVLGSVPQANEGSLRIFAGGDGEAFESLSELLGVFGTATYMGSSGSGAAMKLVVNLTLGSIMCALGEALALGDGFGLDLHKVLDMLETSPIAHSVHTKREKIESGNWLANFRLELGSKDLRLVSEAALARGVQLRQVPAAKSWFDDALKNGMGDLDYSAVIAQIRTALK